MGRDWKPALVDFGMMMLVVEVGGCRDLQGVDRVVDSPVDLAREQEELHLAPEADTVAADTAADTGTAGVWLREQE